MLNELSKPEIVWGIVACIGAVTMGLSKLGLVRISLGRKEGAHCPDPGCHRSVEQIGDDVEHLCQTVEQDIFPKINRTAEAVARIEGYIQGQAGKL